MADDSVVENQLSSNRFVLKETKDRRLLIFRGGRQILMVKGVTASKLSARLRDRTDSERQRVLAIATGNFKRGNERARNL